MLIADEKRSSPKLPPSSVPSSSCEWCRWSSSWFPSRPPSGPCTGPPGWRALSTWSPSRSSSSGSLERSVAEPARKKKKSYDWGLALILINSVVLLLLGGAIVVVTFNEHTPEWCHFKLKLYTKMTAPASNISAGESAQCLLQRKLGMTCRAIVPSLP